MQYNLLLTIYIFSGGMLSPSGSIASPRQSPGPVTPQPSMTPSPGGGGHGPHTAPQSPAHYPRVSGDNRLV